MSTTTFWLVNPHFRFDRSFTGSPHLRIINYLQQWFYNPLTGENAPLSVRFGWHIVCVELAIHISNARPGKRLHSELENHYAM